MPFPLLFQQVFASVSPPVHGPDGRTAAARRGRAGRGQPAPAGHPRGPAPASVGRGPAAAADPQPQRPVVADRGRGRAAAVGRGGGQPAHRPARPGGRPRGGRLGRRHAGAAAHRRDADRPRPRLALDPAGPVLADGGRADRPAPLPAPVRVSRATPARTRAALPGVLGGMLYSLPPAGRLRHLAKPLLAGLVTALAISLIYLAVNGLSDVVIGAVIGVTIPLVAFRMLPPNEVFPVTWHRGS